MHPRTHPLLPDRPQQYTQIALAILITICNYLLLVLPPFGVKPKKYSIAFTEVKKIRFSIPIPTISSANGEKKKIIIIAFALYKFNQSWCLRNVKQRIIVKKFIDCLMQCFPTFFMPGSPKSEKIIRGKNNIF